MKRIKTFLRQWNELLTLPIAILIWYFSAYLFWHIDPTAGTHDVGIFQTFLIATVGLYFGLTIIWLALKIGAPDIYKKLDDYPVNGKELTKWEKGKFSLAYFLGLLFAWVLLVMAFI